MTTMRIVYTRAEDGGVSVVVPAPADRRGGESLADWARRLIAKVVPADASGVTVTDAGSLPQSRRFRNCWRRTGERAVAVDLSLARSQLLAETRAERNRRLAVSDGEKARADEIGTAEERESLRAYRQSLRDFPAAVATELAALASAAALESWAPNFPVVPAASSGDGGGRG